MIIEVTVLLISCCGTVLANIMVLVNVTMKEKLHAPTYFYYLSLAASDLILGKSTLTYSRGGSRSHERGERRGRRREGLCKGSPYRSRRSGLFLNKKSVKNVSRATPSTLPKAKDLIHITAAGADPVFLKKGRVVVRT